MEIIQLVNPIIIAILKLYDQSAFHADIKPSNIGFISEDTIKKDIKEKLIDFGSLSFG